MAAERPAMTAERLASAPGAHKGRTSNRDTEAPASRPARGHRHRDDQSRFFTISEVAERLHVATRTVRRWIVAGDLVVHRVGSVVRISDGDLRAFLGLHREG
jgi:excisionase family DNA binding protein